MFDCTMINDEIDLLEIRLHTLDPVVEKFVIVESNTTHSGKSKEYNFLKNIDRFAQFISKIHYIQDTGVQANTPGEVWFNENRQRDISLSVLHHAQPKDGLFFMADADEIPRPEKLLEAQELFLKNKIPVAFNLAYCMYYFNYAMDVPCRGSYLYDPSLAEEFHSKYVGAAHNPSTIRWHSNAQGYEGDFQNLDNAGWHFSSAGGIDRLREKITNCAHIEFNVPEINSEENIKKSIEQGKLYFEDQYTFYQGVSHKLTKRDIEFLPEYVQDNQEKFEKYILR